jgi:hypothetical protein
MGGGWPGVGQTAPSGESKPVSDLEHEGNGHRDRRTVMQELGEVAGVATILGLGCYAVLNATCTAVYAPLHVRPSDVGLGYTDMLSRAGVAAIGVIVGMTGLLVFFMPFPGLLGFPRFGGWFERAAPSTARWVFVAILLALSTFYALDALGLWPSVVGIAFVVLFFIVGGLGATSVLVDPPRWASQRRRVLLYGLALAVLLPSAALFAFRAFQGSQELQDGRRPSRMAFNLPAPWSAEVVRVTATEPAAAALAIPRCMLLLGQADGRTVLYDARPGHERALHLPTDSVLIEVLPNSKSALAQGSASHSHGELGSCG